jgi:hypothetical protein
MEYDNFSAAGRDVAHICFSIFNHTRVGTLVTLANNTELT